ncbi:GGDEF domain-containing response regulator [bacterium]|nr:GGDEF domain-containing response regulator [bacterium]MCB2179443.1 GGDEF domain-containing response regulator [bacterium]
MDVLVYEDNVAQIEFLRANLNQDDTHVVFVRSGEALIDYLEDQLPALVISNFQLPKGGYELANMILTRVQQPFPYVLYLTDEQNEKYVVDCLGPIPGDFVMLPLREKDLQARMAVAENVIALQEYLCSQDGAAKETSMYDPETNLLNRNAIFERGLVEISRSNRENHTIGVAMIDLVNLDEIFAQHGEELSRLAMRFISNTIRANIRLYDVVGRWANSRFLLLIPGLPKEYAEGMVKRLHQKVEEIKIRLMDDSILEMSFMAGYTCISHENDTSFADIVEQAELALDNVRGTSLVTPVMAFSIAV